MRLGLLVLRLATFTTVLTATCDLLLLLWTFGLLVVTFLDCDASVDLLRNLVEISCK